MILISFQGVDNEKVRINPYHIVSIEEANYNITNSLIKTVVGEYEISLSLDETTKRIQNSDNDSMHYYSGQDMVGDITPLEDLARYERDRD